MNLLVCVAKFYAFAFFSLAPSLSISLERNACVANVNDSINIFFTAVSPILSRERKLVLEPLICDRYVYSSFTYRVTRALELRNLSRRVVFFLFLEEKKTHEI